MKMHRTALFMSLLPLFRYAPQRKQGQNNPNRIAGLTLRETDGLELRKNDDFKLLFTEAVGFMRITRFLHIWLDLGSFKTGGNPVILLPRLSAGYRWGFPSLY